MRLWAEERRSGTIEILLTLPLTVTQAVLGKFFAAWFFLAVGLFLTCPIIFTVSYLGDPDWGLIFTGYLGSLLMAGSYLAVGVFCSALTKNQVISFILAVVACSLLVAAGSPPALDFLSGWVPGLFLSIFESLSFMNHFDSIQKGVLEFKDLLFYIIIICGWLAASVILLRNRKAV
jgi:ABC-2 type transport system permease protein